MATEAQTKGFLQTTVGIVVSVGVLFGFVWVISKAWSAGQKKAA